MALPRGCVIGGMAFEARLALSLALVERSDDDGHEPLRPGLGARPLPGGTRTAARIP